jgi:hypothetical protein
MIWPCNACKHLGLQDVKLRISYIGFLILSFRFSQRGIGVHFSRIYE